MLENSFKWAKKNSLLLTITSFFIAIVLILASHVTWASDSEIVEEQPRTVIVVDEDTASVIAVDKNNKVTGFGIIERVKDGYKYISVRSKEIVETWTADTPTEVTAEVGNSEPTSTEN